MIRKKEALFHHSVETKMAERMEYSRTLTNLPQKKASKVCRDKQKNE